MPLVQDVHVSECMSRFNSPCLAKLLAHLGEAQTHEKSDLVQQRRRCSGGVLISHSGGPGWSSLLNWISDDVLGSSGSIVTLSSSSTRDFSLESLLAETAEAASQNDDVVLVVDGIEECAQSVFDLVAYLLNNGSPDSDAQRREYGSVFVVVRSTLGQGFVRGLREHIDALLDVNIQRQAGSRVVMDAAWLAQRDWAQQSDPRLRWTGGTTHSFDEVLYLFKCHVQLQEPRYLASLVDRLTWDPLLIHDLELSVDLWSRGPDGGAPDRIAFEAR